MYQTIDQLARAISSYKCGVDGAYMDRMVHDIPDTEIIDKHKFVMNKCLDRVVLDIGCSGFFHKKIEKVSKKSYGIDIVPCPDVANFKQMDVEAEDLPVYEDVEIVLAMEIIEHLTNAGTFLNRLAKYKCEKILIVPNAFSGGNFYWAQKRKENTNIDHTAFYSYVTFRTLLKKVGYKMMEFYWYDNPVQIQKHGLNEGMVFVTL
jgi:hypothetical protein